jgi:hypothetical protein
VKYSTRWRPVLPPRSAFAGFRFPPDVIMVAVRLYLRYNLSYRDVKELLIQCGVEVDHVTVFRWVQRFTTLPADAARFGHIWPEHDRLGRSPRLLCVVGEAIPPVRAPVGRWRGFRSSRSLFQRPPVRTRRASFRVIPNSYLGWSPARL